MPTELDKTKINTEDQEKEELRMLSTSDNPFNPFLDFDSWYQFDTQSGYNTCSYLARVAMIDEDSSDLEQKKALDTAIEDIVSMNLTGNYIVVSSIA